MKHSRDSRVEGSSQRSDVRISERQAATFAEAPAAKERSPYNGREAGLAVRSAQIASLRSAAIVQNARVGFKLDVFKTSSLEAAVLAAWT